MALPTPTVLAAATGYIRTGTTRWLKVNTIANINAATSAELTAGTDITNLVSAQTGFSGTGATVDFPNAGSRWTPKVTGLIQADDSSLTLNTDKLGADAQSLFSDGSDGTVATSTNIVIMYEGNSATSRMRVFPVQCTSKQPSADIATPAMVTTTFAIVEPPSAVYLVPTA